MPMIEVIPGVYHQFLVQHTDGTWGRVSFARLPDLVNDGGAGEGAEFWRDVDAQLRSDDWGRVYEVSAGPSGSQGDSGSLSS